MKRGKKKKSGIHCRKPYTVITVDEFLKLFEDGETLVDNVLDWEAGERIVSDGNAVIRIAPASVLEFGLKSDKKWKIGSGSDVWKEIPAPEFINKYYAKKRLRGIGSAQRVSVHIHMG